MVVLDQGATLAFPAKHHSSFLVTDSIQDDLKPLPVSIP